MVQRSTEYTQVLSLLQTMPAEDRAALGKHLKALGAHTLASTHVKVHADLDAGMSSVVMELLKFMQTTGADVPRPTPASVERILTSSVGKGAAPKIRDLWAFVCRQVSNRLERGVLLAIIFQCHYEGLGTWMRSVGMNEMLMHLEKAQTNLDASFPGYTAAGLLGMIVRSRAV